MGEREPYRPSLASLARLAAARPSLMSSLMQLYREREGMDDQEMAAFLECNAEALPRLALCRRPRQAPNFRGDIEAIAARTGANSTRLAQLVRAAETLEALGESRGEATNSTLMAARDYDGPAGEEDALAEGEHEAGEDDSR